MTAKLVFVAGSAVVLWVLHRWIGAYPLALQPSRTRRRDLANVVLLSLIAVAVPIPRMHLVAPWLDAAVPDRTLRELVMVPVLTVPYVILPLGLREPDRHQVAQRSGVADPLRPLRRGVRPPDDASFAAFRARNDCGRQPHRPDSRDIARSSVSKSFEAHTRRCGCAVRDSVPGEGDVRPARS